MADYGNLSKPILPQGESIICFDPKARAVVPQELCAGTKHASRYHRKHAVKHTVTVDSVDVPISTTRRIGGMICLSILSALAFTCALIFHGVMFYYAFDSPMWFMMCWPFILIPPIIFNSIYLACMAKKVPVIHNTKMVYLYVLLTISYMAWAAYIITTTFKDGKCNEASYYSLVVSVLALATVACALEWWLTAAKIIRCTPTQMNVTMAVYEKSPTKRRLVVTLKINGKIIKEAKFNMLCTCDRINIGNEVEKCLVTAQQKEKLFQDLSYNGQYGAGPILLYNNAARYGNEKYKQCPMKYLGNCLAGGSQISSTVCHYENEKIKQEWPMKYTKKCLENGAPVKNENDKIQDQFTEECETNDSALNNNETQNNKSG